MAFRIFWELYQEARIGQGPTWTADTIFLPFSGNMTWAAKIQQINRGQVLEWFMNVGYAQTQEKLSDSFHRNSLSGSRCVFRVTQSTSKQRCNWGSAWTCSVDLLSLWSPSEHLNNSLLNKIGSLGKVICSEYTSQRLDAGGNFSGVFCDPHVPQRPSPFISTSTPVKMSYFLFCKTLLFLHLWELRRRCTRSVLLRHVSVSKQQLSSPGFTNCESIASGCHPWQPVWDSITAFRGGLLVSHGAWKGMGQSEPGAQRDGTKEVGWEAKQSVGGYLSSDGKEGVISACSWGKLHLLLLTASPQISCRKSDRNMLMAGPQALRICSFDCRAATTACAGLGTMQTPYSFSLSCFGYLSWAQCVA